MKRPAYFFVMLVSCICSAQSFPVKNVNDGYVVTMLDGTREFSNNLREILIDNNGLCWFQNNSHISSFDGVSWKPYTFKTPDSKSISLRVNEIELSDDGVVWLGTSDGFFVFDKQSESFIPLKQKFPQLTGMPYSANCAYKGDNHFLFVSILEKGFYILNWKTAALKHIRIDSTNETEVATDGDELDVTRDKEGNYWGLTTDKKGIWHYNISTGEISRSWKDELPFFPAKRFRGRNITGITYSEKDNTIWLSSGPSGILENISLATGRNIFFTFTGDLLVKADTNTTKRYSIQTVKNDRDKNSWVIVGEKYLVKSNNDIHLFEYLVNDPELLPLGKLNSFYIETGAIKNRKQNDNLIWLSGDNGLSVIKKRNPLVRQIPIDTLSTGIEAPDYENIKSRKTIFFEKGKNNNYFLLQKNAGRPKLICFDNNLHIIKTLFNDQWKKYPAYFNTVFNPDTFYIAFLTDKMEPLNFRTGVVRDFKVDLKTLRTEEIKPDFSKRVLYYGAPDADNKYWLFSNGYLYSYEPGKNSLDSLYICKPDEKGEYKIELIKGYDYPTVLHKNSSTFWIDFIHTRELYKINLKAKKVEKIFKSCWEREGCEIPGGVFDIYNFDSSRIYLQQSFSVLLVNPFTDSITRYVDLFNNKLPTDFQMGSGIYNNWICHVTPDEINLLNTISGKHKKLSLNEDFKWKLSQFNSRPLFNDKGEIILMSSLNKGFVVFNLDSINNPEKPGNVNFSFVKLDDSYLSLDSLTQTRALSLKYNKYRSLHFRFSDLSIFNQDKVNYEYTLYNGGDTVWSKIEGEPELTFTRISPGKYQLLVRAGNGYGDYSTAITVFNISIIPPFTQTIWFILLLLIAGAAILYGIYRYRIKQVNRLQTIRNNIASDLHDDIGSTLNSISIYSEVAKQQAGKDIPALDLIGLNSRKIVESMSDIVWAINPENDSFEKIIIRMRSFAYQLLKAKKIEFTFDADEKLNSIALPMQVRKNFYLVFKEAITNLVKYSGATRVSILLTEKNKTIFLQIRDNGSGIKISPETQGNGLLNMKRRAEEISASLNIETATGLGTGVELELKL